MLEKRLSKNVQASIVELLGGLSRAVELGSGGDDVLAGQLLLGIFLAFFFRFAICFHPLSWPSLLQLLFRLNAFSSAVRIHPHREAVQETDDFLKQLLLIGLFVLNVADDLDFGPVVLEEILKQLIADSAQAVLVSDYHPLDLAGNYQIEHLEEFLALLERYAAGNVFKAAISLVAACAGKIHQLLHLVAQIGFLLVGRYAPIEDGEPWCVLVFQEKNAVLVEVELSGGQLRCFKDALIAIAPQG